MIKITDWVAAIPEEEKRLAYVGENGADTRQFLLTGEEATAYATWGFHLDMAFDLSTVTKVSTHQSQTTQESQKETISETATSLTATTTRENRDVTDVTVDCASPTDVAVLTKQTTPEGLVLTWTILRQHTMLPGKLRATLRAVSAAGQVKKSAVMVFDVEAAVVAQPAAAVPLSEFEVMEQRMDKLADAATAAATTVSSLTPQAVTAAGNAQAAASNAAVSAKAAAQSADAAEAAAEKAETKVESLIERNNKHPVSLWVGTKAEYVAIRDKEEGRLYLISDDNDLSDFANPHNLLDNSDFTNPVNQRGKASITCTDAYQPFIDRWYISSVFDHPTTLSVTDEGIDTDVGNVIMWQQRFAPNTFDFANKVYTAVVYQADGGIMVYTNNIVAHNGTYDSVTIPQEFGATAAVALYEGIYTADNVPAYKPKGYAAELAECRQYYVKYNRVVLAGFITGSATIFRCEVPFAMKRACTVTPFGSAFILRTADGYSVNAGGSEGIAPSNINAVSGLWSTMLDVKWGDGLALGNVETVNNRFAALECYTDSGFILSAEY